MNYHNNKIIINSKNEMKLFAEKIAKEAKKGDVFLLKGLLGAGKTFFARYFINFIQEKKTKILSPTFCILNSYQTNKGELFHFDLYRLKDVSELENIGFFHALENGITIIEWPEIAEEYLFSYTQIKITTINNNYNEVREIEINKINKIS